MSIAVDRHAGMLARDGWCVFGRAVEPTLIAGIEADLEPRFAATPLCEGAFYGARTRRFGSLLTRAPAVERLVRHPLILEIVEEMLLPWCERIALNLTQAIEIHPGALPQLPHRDQEMWAGPKGSLEYLVNVMWPLTPFTRSNGGTRLWTGSQFDQDMQVLPEDESVAPTVVPGDALIFLGSALHGGGGNISSAPRRGIIISYCLGWLKPFELQWLVYPPQVARHFSSELAALVGYAQHRPNLGNNDERTAKRISDALGTATEQRAMRNYAGHRLAPWLAHVMVSRQETARALLTPGEVMQLPATDELVLVAGTPPIRATKLRYFEDSNFKSRVLPAPTLSDGDYADRPASRPDDWIGILRGTDARLGAVTDNDGEDCGGGLEQARHPGQEIDRPLAPDPITADPLGLGEDDGDPAADQRAMDQAKALGTASTVYAIDEADHRPGDLQLDF